MAEVEGKFVIIPMRNEKYVVISPAPEAGGTGNGSPFFRVTASFPAGTP